MRRGETHTQQWRNLRHFFQQGWEICIIGTIRIYILTQKSHLTVAILEERARLGQNSLRSSASLTTTRIGDNTIGAEIIATAHNSYIGTHSILIQPYRGNLSVGLLGREQGINTSATTLCLAHKLWQITISIGACDNINRQLTLGKLLLQTLCHTAYNADYKRGFLLT